MKSTNLNIALLIFLASCGLIIGQAFAGPKNASITGIKLQQAYVWYDGKHERQIWLNPDLVAEFSAAKASSVKSSMKSAYPDAVPLPNRYGNVRIWRLGTGTSSYKAVQTVNSTSQSSKYSPVLHDGPAASGRMRALPGNIIVYINPAWGSETVNTWLNERKLEIVKKLEIGPNIFVIKTGPGLEALDTANSLYKYGEVVAAFPDWWEEVGTR